MRATSIPRTPVFGWAALAGPRDASTPCLLSLPNVHYTTSGRASILLALEALGIGAGDRVLLPTYHCPTMVAPVVQVGAARVFYPIDEHGAPRLDWIAAQDLRGVRALLVVHLFGLPQPMCAIRRWCDSTGIALIEDCAHALFGRSGERPIGAWGDMAIASLTKFLPVSEGGCLVVNHGNAMPALAPPGLAGQFKAVLEVLEPGANHERLPGLNGVLRGALSLARRARQHSAAAAPPAAEQDARMPNIEVALAHRALTRAGRWVAKWLPRGRIVAQRRRRYAQLAQTLSGRSGLRPLLPELPEHCAPYVFPLWVDAPDPGYAELRRLGMPVFRWDWLWPGVPTLEGDHGVEWSHHVLQLACHQDLTDAEFERFVDTLLRLYAAVPAVAARELAPPLPTRVPT